MAAVDPSLEFAASVMPLPRADPPTATESALARIRHDLRTPLNQIIGYTEMVQEVAGPELQQDLASVRTAALGLVRQVDTALETVSELLGVATEAQGSAPVTPRPPQTSGDPEPSLPETSLGARILVVDDIEMNRLLLDRRLSARGFVVVTAESGERALELIAEQSFDLVLLDVMMPGLNGIDVLKRLRASTTMSELPVIMATARDGSSDVVEALSHGANDYVTKPIDLAVLIARANSQLALKAATEKVRKLAGELELRNKFIRDAFGRYVTDEVVESLLATPNGLALGGESRVVTVLMSDLRGFSSMSERLSPPEVVTILNRYLGAMTEVIMKYGGTIDEFIGDAILVVFGAPLPHEDHPARAVACALEMQLAMGSVNAENRADGLPTIEMGIGINTGEVVVGNIGSSRRAKYGVVGRSVNTASRIEALTVGGQVLVSSSTRSLLGDALRIDGHLDVTPKGEQRPMRIYDVGAITTPYAVALSSTLSELVLLDEPLHVSATIVDGVHARAESFEGTITSISSKRALLSTTQSISRLSTVKLRFDRRENDAPTSALYAKAVDPDAVGGVILHFTSVPPEVEAYLVERAAGPRSRA